VQGRLLALQEQWRRVSSTRCREHNLRDGWIWVVFSSFPLLHQRREVTSPVKPRNRNKQWFLFCFLLLISAPDLFSSPCFFVLFFFRWQTWRLRKECWRLQARAAGAAMRGGGAVVGFQWRWGKLKTTPTLVATVEIEGGNRRCCWPAGWRFVRWSRREADGREHLGWRVRGPWFCRENSDGRGCWVRFRLEGEQRPEERHNQERDEGDQVRRRWRCCCWGKALAERKTSPVKSFFLSRSPITIRSLWKIFIFFH